MNRHPILSDTQRQAVTTVHFDLDEREIERYWTLSEHDLLRINRRRRDTNRLDSPYSLPASLSGLAATAR